MRVGKDCCGTSCLAPPERGIMKRMSVLAAVMIAAMSISIHGQSSSTTAPKDKKPAKHEPAKKDERARLKHELREMQ